MRGKLDLSALRDSIASLQNAIHVIEDSDWFDAQNSAVRDTLIAGAIQNFEFVYEIGCKMIKRQLELEAANPREIGEASFRDMLRMAAEKGIVGDVEKWFEYRDMRNTTLHTYDHGRANKVYAGALVFLTDAQKLLSALEARNA